MQALFRASQRLPMGRSMPPPHPGGGLDDLLFGAGKGPVPPFAADLELVNRVHLLFDRAALPPVQRCRVGRFSQGRPRAVTVLEIAVRAKFDISLAEAEKRCLGIAGLFRLPSRPSSATIVPSGPGRDPGACGASSPGSAASGGVPRAGDLREYGGGRWRSGTPAGPRHHRTRGCNRESPDYASERRKL